MDKQQEAQYTVNADFYTRAGFAEGRPEFSIKTNFGSDLDGANSFSFWVMKRYMGVAVSITKE